MLIRGPRDAEKVACAWMQDNGFPDAHLTSRGPDGGVDVRSSHAIAQVKADMAPIGAEAIQRLVGIANVDGCKPLFFSLAGYTRSARDFAERAQVPLFGFDYQSEVEALNQYAKQMNSLATPEAVSKRLAKAAARVGITGRVVQEVPGMAEGLRAYSARLAVWTDEVADESETAQAEGTPDSLGLEEYPGFSLDLGGNGYLACYVDIHAAPHSEFGSAVVVYFGGQLIDELGPLDGFFDGSSVIVPTSDRDRLAQLAVGAVAHIADRCGAKPENFRLLPERQGWRPTLVRASEGRGHRNQAWVPLELFEPLKPSMDFADLLQNRSRITVNTSASVLWRAPRFDLHRRGDRVTTRVVVGNRWEFETPGPENLKALVAETLPGASIQCPRPKAFYLNQAEEAVVIRVTTPLAEVASVVAVLVEGLTLSLQDLEVTAPA